MIPSAWCRLGIVRYADILDGDILDVDEVYGFGDFGHDAGCLFVKRWRILSTFSRKNGHFVFCLVFLKNFGLGVIADHDVIAGRDVIAGHDVIVD